MIWIPVVLCLVVVIGLRFIRPGTPENIGLQDGRLADCPKSPNCVSSQSGSESHRIAPLKPTIRPEEARKRLKTLFEEEPGWKLITETSNYWHVEYHTRWMRFVDDVELLFQDDPGLIQVRSASRLGYSDMGANRTRIERLRARVEVLEQSNQTR